MRRGLFLLLFLTALAAAAQQPASNSAPADLQQLVTREFGPAFTVDTHFPPLTADLDGDGQPDLVLVANAKDPMGGQIDFHYRVLDPYDAYFGFGDPKVTGQFAVNMNAGPARFVLVIHNWRAPKAKFVLINLPFDRLSISRVSVSKKRSADAILAEESSGLNAAVFWDGKKYRWEPSHFAE